MKNYNQKPSSASSAKNIVFGNLN